MKENKSLKKIADMSRRTAIKEAGFVSRLFGHQPKVPAKLLENKGK